MLMRDIPDVFRISEEHSAIHARLTNWAIWVTPRRVSWVHPMWRKGKPNGRQWHAPEPQATCEPLKAAEMEKAVFHLPAKHRHVIRWWYVGKYGELRVRRELGVTSERLVKLLQDARQMLVNRGH
jgi:hypothetical protein